MAISSCGEIGLDAGFMVNLHVLCEISLIIAAAITNELHTPPLILTDSAQTLFIICAECVHCVP
jgi:hypothetical protein